MARSSARLAKWGRRVTIAEAETALKNAGFVWDGGRGSHRVWRHPDGRKQVIPSTEKTCPNYILRQLVQMLN